MKDWRFAALDFETTGLDPMRGHEILEAAVVRFGHEGIEERWATLVRPTRPIPPEAAAVHGIRQADVVNAPSLEQVLPVLEQKLAGRVVVLHNAPFDLEFLTSACIRMGRDPIDVPLIDTLLISRRCFSGAQAHSLTELAARLGVAPEGAHRALPDAVTTANVMLALLRRADANPEFVLLESAFIERIEHHPGLLAVVTAPSTSSS